MKILIISIASLIPFISIAQEGFAVRETKDNVQAKLDVGLSTTFYFDDSATTSTSGKKEGSAVSNIVPEIKISIGEKDQSTFYGNLKYNPHFNTVYKLGQSNLFHALSVEAGYSGAKLNIGASVRYDSTSYANVSENSDEEITTTTNVSPYIFFSISPKTSVGLTASYTQTAVDQTINPNNAGADRQEFTVTPTIRYQISPKTNLTGSIGFGTTTYDNAALGEQTFQQYSLGLGWTPSPKLSLNARAGFEMRQYTVNTGSDEISPILSLGATWNPDPLLSYNASLDVSNRNSNNNAGENYVRTSLRAGVTKKFMTNMYASLNGDVENRSYNSRPSTVEYGFRPSVGYKFDGKLFDIFENASIELYYRFRKTDTDERNQVGITSSFNF